VFYQPGGSFIYSTFSSAEASVTGGSVAGGSVAGGSVAFGASVGFGVAFGAFVVLGFVGALSFFVVSFTFFFVVSSLLFS
jgi:hypothetical protein